MAAAALAAGVASPQRASASCILSATHLGQPYLGAGALRADDVGDRAGRATIPACNDTPGAGPVEPATTATVRRVRLVAPRFAMALPNVSGSSELMIADGIPCGRPTTARVLACLRERTTRLLEGPSLIAPPSARAGAVIRLGVHVRDPALRRLTVFGIEARLQRLTGRRWQSVFHLQFPLPADAPPPEPVAVGTPGYGWVSIGFIGGAPRPVRLPVVEPGRYRIVKEAAAGARRTHLVAYLTIRPAASP